jgi:hypothetical protein
VNGADAGDLVEHLDDEMSSAAGADAAPYRDWDNAISSC